jgi:hypothetical protein
MVNSDNGAFSQLDGISESQSRHIMGLARDLIDDLELDRIPAEKLLLKASRLARLTGSEKIQKWLGFELIGYNTIDSVSLEYIGLSRRWINYEKKEAYWGSLAVQEALINSAETRLQQLSNPNGADGLIVSGIRFEAQTLRAELARLRGIRSAVMGLIHTFVAEVYYERLFKGLVESIFNAHKSNIERLIAAQSADVLEKLPAVYSRLSEGDAESVSQALNSCRRIIIAFADAIYPPSDESIIVEGSQVEVGHDQYKNRIYAFIYNYCESKTRRKKLRQSLDNLNERITTGIHNDVSPNEARSLFLEMYLLLGDILLLNQTPSTIKTS